MKRRSREHPDVIAAGHLCLDMFPRFMNRPGQKVADLLSPGTLLKTGEISFSTGGSVSNTGIALKTFGCKVGFVAKVGDDLIGSLIINMLKKQGSAEGVAIARGEPSSYTVVLALAGIDRIFLHCPGTNDTFASRDIDFSLVAKARLFHLGYPSLMDALHADGGRELTRIYSGAKKRGVTTSMDISLPDPDSPAGKADWHAIYRKTLPFVDIFLPSVEEAYFTLHPEEYLERKSARAGEGLVDTMRPEELSRLSGEFLDMGCAMVALKAAHYGWYFRTAPRGRVAGLGSVSLRNPDAWDGIELWCPAFKVERIASATGSGDSSIAGFLAALLRGSPPVECLKMANCAGYMNLRALDALSGLCSWKEMERAIPKLKTRDIPMLHSSDWRWDAKTQVWRKQ